MGRFFRLLLILLLVVGLSVPAQATKYVALTFDDGPSGRFTRRLLEGLEERQAHATFFLCGYRLETYPELAQEIHRQGHEIGLHGYTHDAMDTMSSQTLAQELEATRAMLPQCGVINLLRPPGGLSSPQVRQQAQCHNLSIVSWSLDPKDWATQDAEVIYQRMIRQISDGDVILLHDMSDSSVDGALALIDALTDQGYRFLTVSQLALLRLAQLRPGVQYQSFPPKM